MRVEGSILLVLLLVTVATACTQFQLTVSPSQDFSCISAVHLTNSWGSINVLTNGTSPNIVVVLSGTARTAAEFSAVFSIEQYFSNSTLNLVAQRPTDIAGLVLGGASKSSFGALPTIMGLTIASQLLGASRTTSAVVALASSVLFLSQTVASADSCGYNADVTIIFPSSAAVNVQSTTTNSFQAAITNNAGCNSPTTAPTQQPTAKPTSTGSPTSSPTSSGSPTSASVTTQKPTAKPTTSGSSSSSSSSSDSSSSDAAPTTAPTTASPTTPAPQISGSPVGQCDSAHLCASNMCCSQYNYCGTTDAYCGSGCISGPCASTATVGTNTNTNTAGSSSTTGGSSATGTTTGSSSSSSSGTTGGVYNGTWPSGPIKAIYIDNGINWNAPQQTVTAAIDGGYNLIVFAFYLASGPFDMLTAWNGVSAADKKATQIYAHSKGARLIASFGGATEKPYKSSAITITTTIANYVANNNLDGMDFDLENFDMYFKYDTMSADQVVQWLADATNNARSILGSNAIITHAPQAPYFGPIGGSTAYWTGASGGYSAVYKKAPSINAFLVQFYNQGSTCYTTYNGLFVSSSSDCAGMPGTSVKEIASYGIPASKIVVGKPVKSTGDADNGYVAAATLKTYFATATSDSSVNWPNSGVMGWQWHDATTNANWMKAMYP